MTCKSVSFDVEQGGFACMDYKRVRTSVNIYKNHIWAGRFTWIVFKVHDRQLLKHMTAYVERRGLPTSRYPGRRVEGIQVGGWLGVGIVRAGTA